MKDREKDRNTLRHKLGIVPYRPSEEYLKAMLKHSIALAKSQTKPQK